MTTSRHTGVGTMKLYEILLANKPAEGPGDVYRYVTMARDKVEAIDTAKRMMSYTEFYYVRELSVETVFISYSSMYLESAVWRHKEIEKKEDT